MADNSETKREGRGVSHQPTLSLSADSLLIFLLVFMPSFLYAQHWAGTSILSSLFKYFLIYTFSFALGYASMVVGGGEG